MTLPAVPAGSKTGEEGFIEWKVKVDTPGLYQIKISITRWKAGGQY